ncbi:nucleolar protein 9-like [Babylonia areolata]|uniref:nucleolar protein 9-like n=1 Tax=Babylonia areolata TaxID=304850 RepID=UPI003FD635B4
MNRKFGKKGGRGRGGFGGDSQKKKKGYLPEELMSHYRRVVESLQQFEDEENISQLDHSKGEFLNNVVSSLAEELIQVSQNQTVSSITETIIAAASPANLRTLFVAAVGDLSVTFLDRFASHVLEALVLRLPEFFEQPASDSPDDEDDVAQDKVEESFESLCEFVDSQFETLVTHVYGSHVLRALLEATSGVSVAHELKKSQKSGHGSHSRKDLPVQTQKRKPPETFKAVFDKYSKRLFRVCDYEVHLKDPLFSLLLQAVLMILHKADPELCHAHCQTILQRVADSCPRTEDNEESIPDMAQDTAGSHLLEVIFQLSRKDLMCHTFSSLLQGRLLYYAIHPTGNHVLQRFISSLQDRDLMEKLFEELSKHLEDVLAVGYFGLVTSLAEGCRRLRVRQDDFIMTLMEAFHCKEPQERQKSLMKLIITFTAYEVFFSQEEGKDKPAEGAQDPALKGPLNMHGSRLVQELLQFQKPKHAALGLLDFTPADLQVLCCDPAGSHVVDVFFSSPSILEKNRDIFLRKLKGLLLEVACTKNGSRCLESVWGNLSLAQRTGLAKELADSERLRNDRFGHFLHRSFQLALFATNRQRWQEQQGALAKRKRMMKELLHKTAEPPAKKKKREEPEDREQKEDVIEDSVTALFLRQKRQQDAKRLAPSAQPPETRSDGEDDDDDDDESQRLSPLSRPDSEKTAATPPQAMKKKKKKKKKNKDVKALSSVEFSTEVDGNRPDSTEKKKNKEVKAVSVEFSSEGEGKLHQDSAKSTKKCKRKHQEAETSLKEKVKKKMKKEKKKEI